MLKLLEDWCPGAGDEIIVDLFAGGGGGSEGVRIGLGRSPDVAVNHDPEAVALHKANHPETLHLCQDIWSVSPVWATQGRPVGLLVASPDCTHHSVAKGGAPNRDEKLRDMPWAVEKWCREVRPRVVFMENVRELLTWGPLDSKGKIVQSQKATHWTAFVRRLRRLGYRVEWRVLKACDYGAPTSRERLFMIARRDGQPIVWPEPTHGPGREQPYRTAAECIDFSRPCPSIFDRRKPLAENTLRRIAEGVRRYVTEAAAPFIVSYYNHRGFRGQDVREPLRTISTENRFGLVTPFLASAAHSKTTGRAAYVWPLCESLRTVTSSGGFSSVEPFIVPVAHYNGSVSAHGGREPLRTITAWPKGGTFAVVSPYLVPRHGERPGQAPRTHAAGEPLPVVACSNAPSLVCVHLAQHNGGMVGHEAREPLSSITTTGTQQQLVCSSLVKLRHHSVGQDARLPLHHVTAGGQHFGLMAASLTRFFGHSIGQEVDAPAPSTTAGGGGKTGVVGSFLVKYNKTGGPQACTKPLDTAVTRARFGLACARCEPAAGPRDRSEQVRELLVRFRRRPKGYFLDDFYGQLTDAFAGQVVIGGEVFAIADIGMRMLTPRELYTAQGFRDTYRIDVECERTVRGKKVRGRLPVAAQVRMCGNSVPPPFYTALSRANVPELVRRQEGVCA